MDEIYFTSVPHLFGIGGSLVGLYLLALLGNFVINWVLAWVNDSEEMGENFVWKLSKNRFFTGKNDPYDCLRSERDFGNFFVTILVLLILPLLLFKATTFMIVLVSLVVMAHLARFVVRLNKKFKQHVEDNTVHN